MRITSYRKIIEIMNHPDVKPFIECKSGIPIDQGTYYLEAGKGAILFIDRGKHFDIHSAMIKSDKNKKELAENCLQWMVKNVQMKRCVANVHENNKKARRMCVEMGMKRFSEYENHVCYEREF